MGYVVGPILALLISMKFTHYTAEQQNKKLEEIKELIDSKLVEQDTMQSQQTLRLLTPLAKQLSGINNQLGL